MAPITIRSSTASTYARHMSDDALRERLSEALIDIASLFAKRGQVDKSDTTALILLDTDLNLAQCSAAHGRTMDEFSSIVNRMAKAWPFIATVSRPGVQRMCEEMPISDTDELW